MLRGDRNVVRTKLGRHRRVGYTCTGGLHRDRSVTIARLQGSLQVRTDHRLKTRVSLASQSYVIFSELRDQRSVRSGIERIRNLLPSKRKVAVTDLHRHRPVRAKPAKPQQLQLQAGQVPQDSPHKSAQPG